MTRTRNLFAALTLALASLLPAGSAYALNSHSWVSSTGTGNACTRLAPCADFDTAQTATLAGGVISLLDPSNIPDFFIITKSLTIRAEGVDGGAALTNSSGLFIRIAAAATDSVTLEGLHATGLSSVQFLSGKELHIVGCVFQYQTVAGGYGIKFSPNSASKLSVTDTVITNMGSGTGGGIVINPQPGGIAQVALERVTVNGNAFGIAADGSNSTDGINMTIADSMIAGNAQDGIIATTSSGGAPIGVMVTNTKSVNNAFGIRSLGPNVTVRVKNSDVMGNATGLSFSGGAVLATYGNNAVNANVVNGAFSGSIPLQ